MIAALALAALVQTAEPQTTQPQTTDTPAAEAPAAEPSPAEIHVNNRLRCQATVEYLSGLVPGGPEGAHEVVVAAAKLHQDGRAAGVDWPAGTTAFLTRNGFDQTAAEAWHATTRPLMAQVPTRDLTTLFRQCVRMYGSTTYREPAAAPPDAPN